MKKGHVLFFVLCFLLLSLSPGLVYSADVVAERPTYSEGDYWIFIGADGKSTEWRFLREEKDAFVFSKEGSEVLRDFSLMDVSRAGGFPGPMVRFPLKKGTWWKYEYSEASPAGRGGAAGKMERIARYEATDYEKITVAAGTFWAFKISATIEGLFDLKKGVRQIGSATYWYAPDVKQVIKFEKGDRRWELKEYKIK